MEAETAVKNQLKVEIDEAELSLSEQKILRQKFGLVAPNLSENEADYNLPDFLKVKEFSLAMQEKHFKKGFWRHQWLMNKKKYRLTRHKSQNSSHRKS